MKKILGGIIFLTALALCSCSATRGVKKVKLSSYGKDLNKVTYESKTGERTLENTLDFSVINSQVLLDFNCNSSIKNDEWVTLECYKEVKKEITGKSYSLSGNNINHEDYKASYLEENYILSYKGLQYDYLNASISLDTKEESKTENQEFNFDLKGCYSTDHYTNVSGYYNEITNQYLSSNDMGSEFESLLSLNLEYTSLSEQNALYSVEYKFTSKYIVICCKSVSEDSTSEGYTKTYYFDYKNLYLYQAEFTTFSTLDEQDICTKETTTTRIKRVDKSYKSKAKSIMDHFE